MSAPAPLTLGHPQEEVQQSSSPPSPSSRRGLLAGVRSVASTTLSIAQAALAETEPVQLAHEAAHESKHALYSLLDSLKSNTLAKDAIGMIQTGAQQVQAVDDRKFLLEDVVDLLSKLPPGAPIGAVLQSAFLRILWEDIPKPPATLVGEYRYRASDGGKNNIMLPDLGKAGMPYARSVPNIHAFPENLPDVGVVFDVLLKRDKFEPHPSGISSLLFGFAQLITHSIFITDPQDPNINLASSYLDLSPVYGNNPEEQQRVRTGQQGLIHPDVIASKRIFLLSPSCVALAVLFSRNHNWIARRLVEINEQDRYQPWESLSAEQKDAQDLDIFNTARNINCGWFVNVIFQDYIRTILNISRTDSTWSLVPTGEIKTLMGRLPRGEGNHVSVEFDVLYRWHMASSEKDVKWLEGVMKRWNSGKDFSKMTKQDFLVAAKAAPDDMGDDATKWEFNNFKRGESGAFRDEDIVKTLSEATDNIAGAFKARAIPEVMRAIDMLGMEAARKTWRCCSVNEFRRFLGLKEYKTFEEWNPDKDVAAAAERLYKHVDNLELYPGLMAEQPKPSMEGSGLAPGYSISRAILSDAISLVRGDRFFTTDYNAGNLTSAMCNDLKPELDNGAFGGCLGKLILRHFPDFYTYNSTYALFPFSTPHTTKDNLKRIGIEDQYDLRRPSNPPNWRTVNRYDQAKTILNDETRFSNVYGPALEEVTRYKQPSILSYLRRSDSTKTRESFSDILQLALFPSHWAQTAMLEIGDMTKAHLKRKTWSYGERKFRVDLVSDVAVPVAMEYLADLFGIPLKTKSNPFGLFTVDGLYEALSDLYTFVYLNFDPTIGFKLRDRAMKHSEILRGIIFIRLGQVDFVPDIAANLVSDIKRALTGKGSGGYILSDRARKLYQRVTQSNRPTEELAGVLLIALIRLVQVVPQTANAVDFFLGPERKPELREICKLAQSQVSVASDTPIFRHVQEALRLQPSVTGVARLVESSAGVEAGEQHAPASQLLWIDLAACGRDEKAFSNPEKVDIARSPELYKPLEKASCVVNNSGESYNLPLVTGMVRELCTYNTPSRPAGPEGELGTTTGPKGIRCYAREEGAGPTAFPGSMVVNFQGTGERA
ncbi:hypothetical protein JCM10450v2_004680 [Rhodotorula kratochvilovae]